MDTLLQLFRGMFNVAISIAVLVFASITFRAVITKPYAGPVTFDSGDIYPVSFTVAFAVVSGAIAWRSWRRRKDRFSVLLMGLNSASCLMLVASLVYFVAHM